MLNSALKYLVNEKYLLQVENWNQSRHCSSIHNKNKKKTTMKLQILWEPLNK